LIYKDSCMRRILIGVRFFVFNVLWVLFLDDVAPIVAGVENYALARFITLVSVSKLVKGIATYIRTLSLTTHPLTRIRLPLRL
jgi:hypothetical protein